MSRFPGITLVVLACLACLAPAAAVAETGVWEDSTFFDPPRYLGYSGSIWLSWSSVLDVPEGARVTGVEYRVMVQEENPGETDFACNDYNITLTSEARGWDPGYCRVWSREGGATDLGRDDDTEDDYDIYLDWRPTSCFDGEDAAQGWRVIVEDANGSAYDGELAYVELRVHWTTDPGTPDIDVQPPSLEFQRKVETAVASAADANPYEIKLKARRFVPDAMARGAMKPSDRDRHLIVQFEELPPVETLRRAGLEPLHYVPNNAVVIRVPAGFDPLSVPGVRWAGPLLPTDKIDALAATDLVGLAPSEELTLVVQAFPDVSAEKLEAGVLRAGGSVRTHPAFPEHVRLVTGTRKVFVRLARADAVSWMMRASQRLINGEDVYFCPGARTPYGVVPDYVAMGDGWDGPGRGYTDLTYHFVTGTPDVPGTDEYPPVRDALAEWSSYAGIAFTETDTSGLERSIDILWGVGDHGCGFPFGSELAHAFYPVPIHSESNAGNIDFNDAYGWSLTTDYDVYSVALHEAGHSLGLAHTGDASAVMFAYYHGALDGLEPDDIRGIQSLYAATPVLTIRNQGDAPLEVTGIETIAGGCWLRVWDRPYSILPSERIFIPVEFEPSCVGLGGRHEATIRILSNDPDESSLDVPVTMVMSGTPDLTVSVPQPWSEPPFEVGEEVFWSAATSNKGTGDTGITDTAFYLGISCGDRSNLIARRTLDALPAAGSQAVLVSHSFGPEDADTRYVIAVADERDESPESDEGNNTACYGHFTVVDTIPPASGAAPAGGIYNAPQSVVLTCQDSHGCGGTLYCLGEGCVPGTPFDGTPIDITATAVLRFFSTDLGGNQEETRTESYVIDTEPPVVSIESPAPGMTDDATPLLSYTVSDALGVTETVLVDAVEVETVSGQELSPLADGQHTVRVEAVDEAGNGASAEVAFGVDTLPPLVQMDPVAGPTNVPEQPISGSVEEGLGVTLSVDTSATVGPVAYPAPGSWEALVSQLVEGTNTVTAEASDEAGNTSRALAGIVFDTTPPLVLIDPAVTPTNDTALGLKGSVEEGLGVTLTVDTGAFVGAVAYPAPGRWQCRVTGLVEGENTFTAAAVDRAGNPGSDTLSVVYQPSLEDFETGDLGAYPWFTGGEGLWHVEEGAALGGRYAARAPALGAPGMSYLEVRLVAVHGGDVSFSLMRSAEPGAGVLRFLVDGEELGAWSGGTGWLRRTFPVSQGPHRFRWEYVLGELETPAEAVRLDHIQFPVHEEPVYPVCDVKAAYEDGPVEVATGEPVSLGLSLRCGQRCGEEADWWVLAETAGGWYHYDRGSGAWLPGKMASHQGPLRDVTQFPVDIPALPAGSDTVQFAVDTNMDGIMDPDQLYSDDFLITATPH